eukprot:CAMPEP_0204150878 /NCGR_PEP_ID=MMETSP0361-20130328/25672_1 /ASSEMBLY_ACC=CAM_ASM_000343 /TAXON_ID=268821 /ORGANISM="Scrippsiella Hangoei, Strain SHTV-5" /LENGTH=60 /DNA_ID=CAMNT_0051105615 /DNA_START=8 /DNA_END=186 /DNA_ORIENTATION=-
MRFVRVSRFLKMLRLVRVLKLLAILEDTFGMITSSTTAAFLSITKLMGGVAVFAHFIACS